jgi:four helix bundle protein
MERININRGYKKLRVWNDAFDLYILTTHQLKTFPFEMKKTAGNCIDCAHSIVRNIAEGYCRKSLKEYLNFLNMALSASGEYHASIYSFFKTG